MTKGKIAKQQCAPAVLTAMVCLLLLSSLLVSNPAAAEDQHQHSEPAEMSLDQHAVMMKTTNQSVETTHTKPSEMAHDQHAGMNHGGS